MKVKPLKWKKSGDGYFSSTVFNKVSYTIQTCPDCSPQKYYLYDHLMESGRYLLSIEGAKSLAFEHFCDYLKYEIKLNIDEMKKEINTQEKLLSKCLVKKEK